MFSLDLVSFFLASFLALALIYYKVSTGVLQQGVALLLVILLILYKRFIFKDSKIYNKLFRLIFLFSSSLLVQLLVISSGGFYSPFLILLHLYTLGTSFLLNIGSAISFLLLSLIVILSSTFLNQTLLSLFKQDPGSVILYLVSFLAIIPLAQFLMRTYHLKDTISKLLTETLAVGEKREQSILQGLNELVLVTNTNLKILSFNEAVEKSVAAETIKNNNLLEILHLKDQNGSNATLESLSLNKVLEDRVTHLVEGFYLETKSDKLLKVVIQIRPVTNPAGEITQIAFVITDARAAGLQRHSNLEKARQRHQTIWENLQKAITSGKLPAVASQAILLSKADGDLLLAQELEDHPFKRISAYQDLAELCQQVNLKKQEFAKALGVLLQFSLPKEEVKEAAYLSLKASNLPSQVLHPSDFSVPTDPNWLATILDKLLDISILLLSGQLNPRSILALQREDNRAIEVSITSSPVQISNTESQELFKDYFGNLASKTNLRFGSGLEGFIAKTISAELNLPIKVETSKNTLIFKLTLTKELK